MLLRLIDPTYIARDAPSEVGKAAVLTLWLLDDGNAIGRMARFRESANFHVFQRNHGTFTKMQMQFSVFSVGYQNVPDSPGGSPSNNRHSTLRERSAAFMKRKMGPD